MDVREKLVELPIEDALLVLREEHRQRTDSYTTYLAHGGKGGPAEEVGLDALAMAISALEKTKWISVEDRLPESGVHVLICCEMHRYGGEIAGKYVCDGYYAEANKIIAGGFPDECNCEYSEEDDEYYLCEGWYEVIKNWDDYSSVTVEDFVTHWMPLPKPPKGE